MRLVFIYISFALLCTLQSFSQDIHFSMSYLSPINLNPAETGNYQEDYRLHLNQRTQWRSITVPYVTFSASFESNWRQLKIPGLLSSALIFNNDKAGDGNFGTNQIGLANTYKFQILDSTTILALGIVPMWNQHSINYSKFYFDNQYNGYMFDPSIPVNENFAKQNMQYFDVHAGIRLTKYLNNTPINFGFSLYHINKPRKTFYKDLEVTLDRKFNLYSSTNIALSKQTFLLPQFFWFQQKMLREIYIGALLHRKTQDYSFKGYYIGGWFRLGDAAILSAAIDYKDIHIAISYDFNISPLVSASNGRGGLEIAIKYVFMNPQKTLLIDKHICPTFL